MEISILELFKGLFYFAGSLSFFVLSAVLFRVFKILGPVLEILEIYKRVKGMLSLYGQVPDIAKQKLKEFMKK